MDKNEILAAIAGAQAKANQLNHPCYVVRDPTTKQYDLVPADFYVPTNRRRIIEFIAFSEQHGD